MGILDPRDEILNIDQGVHNVGKAVGLHNPHRREALGFTGTGSESVYSTAPPAY